MRRGGFALVLARGGDEIHYASVRSHLQLALPHEAVLAPKPSTRPRKAAIQERSRATVDALLDATARILTKHGYDRASTNRVAEAAGVSIGSLYQYFPSKEALVASLMERHVDEIRSILHAEMPRLFALPLEEGIQAAVRLMVAAHAHDPK